MPSDLTGEPGPIPYPFDPTDRLGLHATYLAVQQGPGVVRIRMPKGELGWLVTRYDDARFVLGDARFGRLPPNTGDAPRVVDSDGVLTDGVLTQDAPNHARLRRLVTGAFTMRRAERLRPRIRELAESCFADLLRAGPPADLVDHFALPLPAAVICELLGVPAADRDRFRTLSDAVLSTSKLTAAEAAESLRQLRDYMAELVERHRRTPDADTDNVLSTLVQARDQGDRLSEAELVDMGVGILVAGYETTATQIPNFLLVLLEHPDRFRELRARPELVPAAVEELMRLIPFFGADFPRYPREDLELGGVLVRAGEPVLVAVGAANRDAARFPAPHEVRFDREQNHHMGFGHGVHHCLGASLARVELQEALRVLLAKLPPTTELAGDVGWKVDMLVRGPHTLPLTW
ncbi:cytochrome P450 [Streptoalloteichus hindustanus]|uniref:Cytochrome P450 n=1 Tax=Streptoalloteichus hindustanus TaxID=2017 RepID=A0A1M5EWS9_STRHI|nr:cytochrome P450 [Streptoalloteichus hindustanus]SHF83695.1 Cytochrome P450 [Streptoalloteichus hindustanus]